MGIARFGAAVGETSDQHVRVWIALPDRWRFESGDRIELRDGARRWVGSSTHITELAHDDTALGDTDIGLLVASGPLLLGALRFGDPADDEVAGRPCLKVTATVHDAHGTRRFDPLPVRLGGLHHTFWFDVVTGIALRHVGLLDGEPCTLTEFTEVTVDPAVTDLDFGFVAPPGAVVTRQIEHLIRIAELHGADLTGVDTEDPRAVQAAIHDVNRPDRPMPAARLEQQRSKHVPVGEPPSDVAGARTAIEHAFTHHDEVDASGDDLVNVQSGRGLAGPLREAQQRVPAVRGSSARFVVDDIRFLRRDEAVVWFSIELDGDRFPMVNGREGRAVLIGDRWLIEHATIVDLLLLAGVAVPPP